MKSAHSWHVKPSSLLPDSKTELGKRGVANLDTKLMMAWDQLKDETCPKCGLQIWICRSTDNYIQFKVAETVCFASQVLEQEAHELSKKKDAPKEFGVQKFARPEMTEVPGQETRPLPSRAAYIQESIALWEYEQKQKEGKT